MKLNCANCSKSLGEITKGRLHPKIKYICQRCLDKLFKAQLNPPKKDPLNSFTDLFK